jgi:sarcosine oxidase
MRVSAHDVIVIGLGTVGSAACYHLARRGQRVLGLDRFTPAHPSTSVAGETRVFRKAYADDERYIPLLHRSEELWLAFEREADARLLVQNGVLVAGPAGPSGAVSRLLENAARHQVEVEELDADALGRRFPRFRVPVGLRAVFEPRAGYVLAEKSVLAYLARAEAHGAELRTEKPALAWSSDGSSVEVQTARGAVCAERLVIAAGAWSAALLADLGLPLRVRRIPYAWYRAGREWDASAGNPCFLFHLPDGLFYGIPPHLSSGRFKVAGPSPLGSPDALSPEAIDRGLHQADFSAVRQLVADALVGVDAEPLTGAVCLCTMTPDERFVVDRHPRWENVVFAAGLSGHGFKFAPVLGEILCDLSVRGASEMPIDFLRLRRRAGHDGFIQ